MPVDFAALDRVFNPKTLVVIGDKKASDYMWLNANREFKGRLYSVQIDPKDVANIEAMGIKNYPSLADIPEPIDYAIVAVPRVVVGRIVADCIKYKVGGATLFTSGFAETATPEGIKAQAALQQMARDAGMVLIGPNCMGLYNPSLGLRWMSDQAIYEGGFIGFASQSGSHAGSMAAAAPEHGLAMSKIVSFGNGIVLENADYLDYFARDPRTRIIGMYVEGLHDGPRFFKLLKETTPKKPVVIWKGGQTKEGQRATSSHTASMAESMTIWRAMAQQAGAILVGNLEEMLDTLKALAYLPKVTGVGCALTGGAGGQSVSITDAFAAAGMGVPALSPQSYQKLESFFSLVGASFRNPIDMGSNRAEVTTILDILNVDPAIDIIVMQFGVTSGRLGANREAFAETIVQFKQRAKKPVVVITHAAVPYRDGALLQQMSSRFHAAGIPTFANYDRAARALKNVVDFHRFHTT